jgi:MFS family permease
VFGIAMTLTTTLTFPAWVVSYIAGGMMNAAISVSGGPYLMAQTPAEERTTYFGLTNSILGFVMLLGAFVGLLVDAFGYGAGFVFCGLMYVISLLLALKLKI